MSRDDNAVFELEIKQLYLEDDIDKLASTEEAYADFLYSSPDEDKTLVLRYYQLAYDHYRDLDMQPEASQILWKIIKTQRFLGQFDRCIYLLSRILENESSRKKTEVAQALIEMGNLFRLCGEYSKSKSFIIRASNFIEDNYLVDYQCDMLFSKTRFYISQYDAEEAVSNIDELEKRASFPGPLLNLMKARVKLIHGEDISSVINISEGILANSDQSILENMLLVAKVNLNLALALLVKGNSAGAKAYAENAVSAFENCGHWRVFEAYHILARCLLANDDISNAQVFIEKGIKGFLNLSLYNRINNIEQTMHRLYTSDVTSLSQDELQYEFGNVAI